MRLPRQARPLDSTASSASPSSSTTHQSLSSSSAKKQQATKERVKDADDADAIKTKPRKRAKHSASPAHPAGSASPAAASSPRPKSASSSRSLIIITAPLHPNRPHRHPHLLAPAQETRIIAPPLLPQRSPLHPSIPTLTLPAHVLARNHRVQSLNSNSEALLPLRHPLVPRPLLALVLVHTLLPLLLHLLCVAPLLNIIMIVIILIMAMVADPLQLVSENQRVSVVGL